MTQSLDEIVSQAKDAFALASSAPDLEDAKARFLGKQGLITERMKALAALDVDAKKEQGARINVAKQAIEAALATRRSELDEADLNARLAAQRLDVSLPGRTRHQGGLHPVTQTWMRIEEIFASIGFDVADGPEIETDWYSFTALNNPENHPARSMQDTFYVDARDSEGRLLCLRPHTSPMQVRYAQAHRGPVRVICPGKTYRVDSDATHSPMFHQFEGLWMDEGISLADLKSVFSQFLVQYFETDRLNVRFRPSYFPFTEPSAEVDVMFEEGALAGRWLEVAGSGQVHPQVVRNFGLDPEKTIGFAFGSGIERLAMLRHGVSDLRLFYENDLRFLRQFAR
ncbi:phenylalanine--tRNA ligase subunit alpha [Piscinibacterium candidicorallinum]|jgi:phenylalanyl-tRNA synthetase alpha chain|uniref:Phenylalanine--tRNA ligase alpha subunit n=1 Tax=Piscinibacterium candidicorallinum TaxID=1793872 RepID=A0ABV7H3Q0_9BURK